MRYRLATLDDSAKLLAIYSHYIDTPITFECSLPTKEEFEHRIMSIGAFYPYIVVEDDEEILGYAYAHRHMQREAYQWNAEFSIYLSPTATSMGLGTQLAKKVLAILRLQGIQKVTSGITQPNEKSDGLHAKLGFKLVGTYSKAGYKGGLWHDVSWFEKELGTHPSEPQPPVSIKALDTKKVKEILNDQ